MCVIVALGSHYARAAQLENISPGLMCESGDALAKLTLPNGSSKLNQSGLALPEDISLGNQGRCVNAPLHIRVNLVSARKQTSIVTFDNDDSRGPVTYYVANKVFQPPTGPSACVPTDAHITLRGKVAVIASKDRNTGKPYTYIVLHGEKPYCTEPALDNPSEPSREVVLAALDGGPNQTALRKLNGQTVSVAGKLSNARNGELLLFEPELVP